LLCTEGTSGPNIYGEDPKAPIYEIQTSNKSNIAPNNGNYYVSTTGINIPNNHQTVHISGLSGVYAGQTFSTTQNITFGRDPQKSNVIFAIEQPGISSVHCTVSVETNGIYLTDSGSTFDTFLVNGTKLAANQKVKMKNKDIFYLSSELNKFEIRID